MKAAGCTLLLCALAALALTGASAKAVVPGEVGICAFMCGPEKPCPKGQECVGTPCGGTSCGERSNKVKRQAGICAFTCGPEQPCAANEKCVKTGCGGTQCQKQ